MLDEVDQDESRDQSAQGDPRVSQMTAKRVANFATNMLVTGVILIVGISFGREVVLWWRTDKVPESLPAAEAAVPGQVPTKPGEIQLLEFGDFPFALNRQEFVGDAASATERLRATSRNAIAISDALTQHISDAERRMLAAAKRLKPVEQLAENWAIYQIESPVPMVIGTRKPTKNISASEWRVVSWGMAVPNVTPAEEPQSDWTLFTYTSDTAAGSTVAKSSLPAPPNGRRTVSLRTDHGGVVIGYAGDSDVATWTKFYEALFGDQPDKSQSTWQVDRGIWRCRFLAESSEVVDVVISPDTGGSLRCLVITSPNL